MRQQRHLVSQVTQSRIVAAQPYGLPCDWLVSQRTLLIPQLFRGPHIIFHFLHSHSCLRFSSSRFVFNGLNAACYMLLSLPLSREDHAPYQGSVCSMRCTMAMTSWKLQLIFRSRCCSCMMSCDLRDVRTALRADNPYPKKPSLKIANLRQGRCTSGQLTGWLGAQATYCRQRYAMQRRFSPEWRRKS